MLTPHLSTPAPRRRVRIPVWSVLVTLLAILAAVIIIPRMSRHQYTPYELHGKTLSTKPGTRTKMTLPDGTQVWLNGDSRLTYDIGGWNRKVQLEGEAYFIIAKGHLQPLLIHTAMLDLRATAGIVNINAYDSNSEVDCIEEPVSATLSATHLAPDAAKSLKIRPGTKLFFSPKDSLPILSDINYNPQDSLYEETAWVRNKLYFQNKSMGEIVPILERWYDTKITLTGTMLPYQYYTANITDLSLQKTLETLSAITPFSFTIDNDKKEVHITGADIPVPVLRPIWTSAKARSWYTPKGWLRGSDFIVSTAVNQLEMWQAATFDPKNIDKELGYAQSIGLNCMRVFLHHVAWEKDPVGFKNRMEQYLDIAGKHHISTIFVFFDDCWNETYHAGPQPAPKTGVHNSGWLRDPGKLFYDDSTRLISLLEMYVRDVLSHFRNDQRILLWDLYNEPGNSGYGNKSLSLLQKVFDWGHLINPDQPLSAGVWSSNLPELNAFQLTHSDVITYHDYQPLAEHQHTIDTLKHYGRPLICTEYMARTHNSTFFTIMPMLKKEHVGAINWGLVAGKTNTKYSWEKPMPDGSEPPIWFHEIFRPDGSPYDPKETALIRSLTGAK